MTDKMYGTLYIGVTSDLEKRIWQHKNGIFEGFTKKYKLHRLVWYEMTNNIDSALSYEKKLKKWNRTWKVRLIQEKNPNWEDLGSLVALQGFPPARE